MSGEQELLHRLLAELGIVIGAREEMTLLALRDELLRWNRRVNLTAIRDPEEALEKHLVDSLTLCPLLGGAGSLLDIGSGAGFPALPLKVVRPTLAVVAVDAVQKKIAFQRSAVRLLGLSGYTAVAGRAEVLAGEPGFTGAFDLVVSRALGRLGAFAALARPFLAPGGRIVAMKGGEGPAELASAEKELDRLGLRCRTVRELTLPKSGNRRSLLVLDRIPPQDMAL